jgi:hypothetical protein
LGAPVLFGDPRCFGRMNVSLGIWILSANDYVIAAGFGKGNGR